MAAAVRIKIFGGSREEERAGNSDDRRLWGR